MKKAVITILGLAGVVIKNNEIAGFKNKTIYDYENVKKEYLNDLPFLIDLYGDEYRIIPIYTSLSKKAQIEVLKKENKEEWIEKIFSHSYGKEIEDENKNNSYDLIFNKINKILKRFSSEDKVIIDITHGFRHLPILVIINTIMHYIKEPEKIEKILFAKEIVREKEYKIIDIKDYLELANLSFILVNFKENYTIAKHIKVNNPKYQNVINCMNEFSSDLLALSLENLLNRSAKNLIFSIENLEDNLLLNDWESLKAHIEKVFSKQKHRYLTYYLIAKDLYKKGYLVHVVSLLFEGIGFYAKSRFETYDKKLKKYIHFLENEIKYSKNFKNAKIKDYYELTSSCRSYLLFNRNYNRDKLFHKWKDIIYSNLPVIEEFNRFVWELNILRNNLLHANSGKSIAAINMRVKYLLEDFEKYCINFDVLKK